MTWPTHAAGGIAALWLLVAIPSEAANAALAGVSAATWLAANGRITGGSVGLLATLAAGAALLPDLDAQRSKIRSLAVGPIQPFDVLGTFIYGTWGHRGPLHSLPGLAVFGLIVALPLGVRWGGEYGAASLLGYGSHIALDAMTRHGVPLWPTRGQDGRWGFRHQIHLLPPTLRFVTGSAAEDVLQVILFGADILLLFNYMT